MQAFTERKLNSSRSFAFPRPDVNAPSPNTSGCCSQIVFVNLTKLYDPTSRNLNERVKMSESGRTVRYNPAQEITHVLITRLLQVTCLFKAVSGLLNTEYDQLIAKIRRFGPTERRELATALENGCSITQMNRWLVLIEIDNVHFRRIEGQTGVSEQDDWQRAHRTVWAVAGTRQVGLACGKGGLGHAVLFSLESKSQSTHETKY